MAYLLTPGIPGDFNGDGTVDAADYVVWRENDGTPAGYDTWRANFGKSTASGASLSAAAAGQAVPEPNSLLLAALAAVLIRRTQRPFRSASRAKTALTYSSCDVERGTLQQAQCGFEVEQFGLGSQL